MRIVEFNYIKDELELILEKSFLWFKYRVTYRKRNGVIFKYKKPDKYINVGAIEWMNVNLYFKYRS